MIYFSLTISGGDQDQAGGFFFFKFPTIMDYPLGEKLIAVRGCLLSDKTQLQSKSRLMFNGAKYILHINVKFAICH